MNRELNTPPREDDAAAKQRVTRIGTYQLLSLLGAGGMGEVYRARDGRLQRDVAIKILPREFTTDEDRLARLEREARVLAALNHPNVGAIYGIEETERDGATTRALILELVEGDTLQDRIARGPMPIAEATAVGRQIAAALEAAHEAGIIHRDLKPANIKVTRSGLVKVLDFGLAKTAVAATDDRSADASDVSTVLVDRTQAGLILGTAGYMSPEQARGHAVDKRTDIWSFGCILFEMLTGRRPFGGGTFAEVMAATLEREPDWTQLPTRVPDAVSTVLRRCLEKDPTRRLRDIGEARLMLESMAGGDDRSRVSDRSPQRTRTLLVAAGVTALAIVAAVVWLPRGGVREVPAQATRLTVALPVDQELDSESGAAPLAISPDGRSVVYAAHSGPRTQLFLRALDAFQTHALNGTDGARYPFFSPDGRSVAFFANGKLLRLSLAGGAPVPVCDVPVVGHGATWGSDGTIVYPGPSGLMRVSAEGGRVEPLVSSDAAMDQRRFHWPQFLPNGEALLAAVGPGLIQEGHSSIAVFSFRTRQWRVLTEGSQPQFVPPGYLAFHADHVREGEVQVAPFDVENLKLTAAPVSFLNGIFRARSGGAAYFAVSRSGTLVFSPGGLARTLVRVDQNGRRTPIVDDRLGFRFPRLSPDGTKVAVTIDPRPSQIWVYDLTRGGRIPLATTAHSLVPVWSPDGQRIVYASGPALYSQPADGSGPAERLVQQTGTYAHSWSRDGRFLMFQGGSKPENKDDLWMLPIGGTARLLLGTAANELHPAISPDGRWLAYTSDESGRSEVYLRPFPDLARKWPISTDGGHSPQWSRDGRQLYFMNGAALMAVSLRLDGNTVVPEAPRMLFSGPFDTTQDNNYDVWPDGIHFLMIEAAPESMLHGLDVVINWSTELQRDMAAKQLRR